MSRAEPAPVGGESYQLGAPQQALNPAPRANSGSPTKAEELRREGNAYLRAGAGIGTIGIAGGLLLGSVCPVCIVATPALLGLSAYKRWQATRALRTNN